MIAAKQLQELPYEKRDGNRVARAYANRIAFNIEKSTSEAQSLIAAFDFYPRLVKELEESPESVIKSLEEVRTHRTSRHDLPR